MRLTAQDDMFPGLPEGLVATKLEVRGGLESVDRVDVDDVARLWKGMSSRLLGSRRNRQSC